MQTSGLMLHHSTSIMVDATAQIMLRQIVVLHPMRSTQPGSCRVQAMQACRSPASRKVVQLGPNWPQKLEKKYTNWKTWIPPGLTRMWYLQRGVDQQQIGSPWQQHTDVYTRQRQAIPQRQLSSPDGSHIEQQAAADGRVHAREAGDSTTPGNLTRWQPRRTAQQP